MKVTIECKSILNPLHKCSNPAVVNLNVREYTILLFMCSILFYLLNCCLITITVELNIPKKLNILKTVRICNEINNVFDEFGVIRFKRRPLMK